MRSGEVVCIKLEKKKGDHRKHADSAINLTPIYYM